LLGPRVKMTSFYRGLDLYVHSSHSEALSMAILEAMSHAQPVVAFAVGGTPAAVIHDETGILAAPKDDFALRHAMIRLIEDPVIRKTFGAAGRQRIEQHFSVERMVQAYESLYLRVVAPPSSASPRARLQFTGAISSPALDDTIVFLTTTGDDTGLEECIERLRAQTVRCSVVWIDGLGSLPAALNRMHTLCTSPYYVRVTGEMLLAPDAIEHLRRSLDGSPPDLARVSAPLWDHEMGEPVPAIAIHRHAIVQQFPYQDILGCEALQSGRIRAAGFQQLVLPPDTGACLGEFGKHGSSENLFRRWQWSFQRHNRHGHAQWLDPWPRRLLDRYIESRDPRHLYALLGAIAGIAVKAEGGRELDWREADPALHRMRYYFPVGPDGKGHPLATIVIPLLRQKDAWLEQAVRSAAKQTAPCEVIVVLSLRTPPSNRDLVNQLAAQHPNVKILTEEREGFPQSLNTGIRAARTERIGFLLSDDWLEPDCLAECLALNADIVSTSHSTVYEDGVTPVEGGDRPLRLDEFLACSTHELRASYLTHFLLFHKAALERAGYVDESIGDYPGVDDYHLPWTMLEQGASVAVVERYLYRMRDHAGDRLTLADPAQARRNLEKILCKHGVVEPEYSRILTEHSHWFGRPMNVVLSELRQKS
jgi:Glycosyl transferases group 1/Glycosyl transferase family 2